MNAERKVLQCSTVLILSYKYLQFLPPLPSKLYWNPSYFSDSLKRLEFWSFNKLLSPVPYYIQLFRVTLSEKMFTWQPQKVIWDMINTLFLTLKLSKLLLLLSFSTRKHTSMASRAILSNFFEKQWIQNHAQYLSGLWRAVFPTTSLEIAVFTIFT